MKVLTGPVALVPAVELARPEPADRRTTARQAADALRAARLDRSPARRFDALFASGRRARRAVEDGHATAVLPGRGRSGMIVRAEGPGAPRRREERV